MEGTWTIFPLRRWKSRNRVLDTSSFWFHAPLKYSALARINAGSLFTDSNGRTSLISPLVFLSAHKLTSCLASSGLRDKHNIWLLLDRTFFRSFSPCIVNIQNLRKKSTLFRKPTSSAWALQTSLTIPSNDGFNLSRWSTQTPLMNNNVGSDVLACFFPVFFSANELVLAKYLRR